MFLVDLVYVCVVLKFTGKNIYLQKMRKKFVLCKIFHHKFKCSIYE